MDFGLFEQPFVDPKRLEFLKKKLKEDFGHSDMKKLRNGLRPISPDEMPIIGALSHCPNVILNVGYGP